MSWFWVKNPITGERRIEDAWLYGGNTIQPEERPLLLAFVDDDWELPVLATYVNILFDESASYMLHDMQSRCLNQANRAIQRNGGAAMTIDVLVLSPAYDRHYLRQPPRKHVWRYTRNPVFFGLTDLPAWADRFSYVPFGSNRPIMDPFSGRERLVPNRRVRE